jgi:cytochrome c-type biogenesis protein CcmE
MTEPESDELAREASEAREEPEAERPKKGVSPALKIALVLTALSGAVAFLLLQSPASDSLSYSKLVHEVVDDPEAFAGRQLRVEGQLRQGSIQFRADPCEWRFVIESQGRSLPVAFPECIVPDTFKDAFGIQVTVQGHLQENGRFLANEVIPRCPSKYEMQQRLENGEAVPHPPAEAAATPGVAPTTPAAPAPTEAPATPPG